jgi:hypothetical protein
MTERSFLGASVLLLALAIAVAQTACSNDVRGVSNASPPPNGCNLQAACPLGLTFDEAGCRCIRNVIDRDASVEPPVNDASAIEAFLANAAEQDASAPAADADTTGATRRQPPPDARPAPPRPQSADEGHD